MRLLVFPIAIPIHSNALSCVSPRAPAAPPAMRSTRGKKDTRDSDDDDDGDDYYEEEEDRDEEKGDAKTGGGCCGPCGTACGYVGKSVEDVVDKYPCALYACTGGGDPKCVGCLGLMTLILAPAFFIAAAIFAVGPLPPCTNVNAV